MGGDDIAEGFGDAQGPTIAGSDLPPREDNHITYKIIHVDMQTYRQQQWTNARGTVTYLPLYQDVQRLFERETSSFCAC